jgi:hypothetical protein
MKGTARRNELKEHLKSVLGSAPDVLDNSQSLEDYARDLSFAPQRRPRAVVKPRNKSDVQEIIKWANQTSVPLIPVSSGPPHLHGDTVPSAGGAIIMDLAGMNRIMLVDRKNRMAIIEPGVTFAELQPEVEKEGLKLSMPLLPRGSKSVLTSVLEREPVMVPKYQWQLLDPLRFLEVVWGSGESLRTGEGGLYPAQPEGQPLKQTYPIGPLQTDYYRFLSGAQGSMGVVVWEAVKCEVLPKIHEFFFVPAETPEALIDFAYRLLRYRYGDELFLMNNTNLAYIFGESPEQIQSLKAALPQWALVLGIAGRERMPEERVEFQKKDISDIAQLFGLKMVRTLYDIPGDRMRRLLSVPSSEPHWKIRYKGGSQDIFFLTTLDKTQQFVKTMYSVAQANTFSTSDVGIYLQPLQQGAACHCEFTLPYDPQDVKETGRMRKLFSLASEALVNQGAFFSRPYGAWAHMMYNRDAQNYDALTKIKGIFDPNNVMNPGRLFGTTMSWL